MQPRALLESMSSQASCRLFGPQLGAAGQAAYLLALAVREVDGGVSAVGVGARGDGCQVGQLIKSLAGKWALAQQPPPRTLAGTLQRTCQNLQGQAVRGVGYVGIMHQQAWWLAAPAETWAGMPENPSSWGSTAQAGRVKTETAMAKGSADFILQSRDRQGAPT